jgi:molybdopterin-binding protein
MKISARNVLKGKVKKLVIGPVSAQVAIEVAPKIVINAVITSEAAKDLALAEGKEAYAVIKASTVIVGVD